MTRTQAGLAVALLYSLLTSPIAAQTPTVIYSNLPGTPTNQIPGGLGMWDTDFSFFTLNLSPSGEFWLMNFQEENTDPEVLILGTGLTGSAVLVEDVDMLNGRIVEGIDSSGRVNDSGQWVVGADFSGDSATDDAIIGGDTSGATTLYAQEGAPIDAAYGFGADNTWDAVDTTAIDASGRAWWIGDGVDGPAFTSANDEFIATSAFEVIAQKGVDSPGNQGDMPRPYDDFDLDDLHVSADGAHWLARGDVGSPTTDDDALFVDGQVVIRENFTLSAIGIQGADDLTLIVDGLGAGIDQQFMAGNGDWYAFGQLSDDDTNWAVRNGVLIAASGTELFPGANEFWDDPNEGIQDFAFLVGNSEGDYILGGLTTAGDEVLVINGEREVLRSGTAVDLDGDGVGDDVFFDSFEFQETRLGDNLQVYSLVNFVDAAGLAIGSGFITLDASPAPADSDQDGITDDADNCIAVANADQLDSNSDGFGNACDADLDNDCAINFLDLGLLKAAFFTEPDDPAWNPDADLVTDAQINFSDLGVMKLTFFGTPGPTALTNACD